MPTSWQRRTLQCLDWTLKFVTRFICFLLLMFSLETPAMAQPLQPSLTPQEINPTPKAIALRFAKDGWGTQPQWQQVWDDVMAPNVIHHFSSLPDTIVGLEANKEFNHELFIGFPKLKSTIENIVAEDDIVMYRSTLEGQQSGPFLGIPATHKTVKLNDFTLLKFKDGKISEWWYETNLLSVMQQLGVMPEESSP